MSETFLKSLCSLEKYYLVDESEKLEGVLQVALKKLVEFIEGGSFITSESEKFILRNFRLKMTDITKKWNKTFGVEKSPNTMRCQSSTLNSYLVSLFGITGDELNEIFVTKDIAKAQEILNIIEALEVGDVGIKKEFSILQGYLDKTETRENYVLSECEAELKVLKTLSNTAIQRLLSEVDINKLIYLLQIMDEPLVTDVYISREERRTKVKVAVINREKVQLYKEFVKIKPKQLKSVAVSVEVEKVEEDKSTSGVEFEAVTGIEVDYDEIIETEENLEATSDELNISKDKENEVKKSDIKAMAQKAPKVTVKAGQLSITEDMLTLIRARASESAGIEDYNDTNIESYKGYLLKLNVDSSVDDLKGWLGSTVVIDLCLALDELDVEH